jgi:ABC-type nitrate/sulfonate/bicarbonate transport system permease component
MAQQRGNRQPHRWPTTWDERSLYVATPLLLLGLWQLAASRAWIETRFFPAPLVIVRAGVAMTRSGELPANVALTLARIGVGFVLGAVPGVVLGLAIGLFRTVRAALQPIVDATFPVPKIALLPLFILIFGLGEASKYAVVAVSVVYLVLINTAAGVRGIDRVYLDVAHNVGASRRTLFVAVALPAAMPMIVTGLRLGIGVALLVIVSAEFVGARSGLGYLIWSAWQEFQVERMYVGLLAVAVLGVFSALLMNLVEYLLMPWRRSARLDRPMRRNGRSR